jgi:hypothetical protein
MGIRGIIRDIVSVYLGFEIMRGYLTGEFYMLSISVAGMVLFGLALWFLLERTGILPRLG